MKHFNPNEDILMPEDSNLVRFHVEQALSFIEDHGMDMVVLDVVFGNLQPYTILYVVSKIQKEIPISADIIKSIKDYVKMRIEYDKTITCTLSDDQEEN